MALELPLLLGMRFRTTRTVLSVAIAIGVLMGGEAAQATDASAQALQRFQERVDRYLSLRHSLEPLLPPLRVSPEPERIHEAADALAAAIRAARRDAEMGDIFTADVQSVLRRRIQKALREQDYAVEDLLADLNAEVPPGAVLPAIEINGSFPWAFGAATPSYLLAELPELPAELEYRFIARDLLLVDIDAGIVVDILLDALPRPAPPDWRVANVRTSGVGRSRRQTVRSPRPRRADAAVAAETRRPRRVVV